MPHHSHIVRALLLAAVLAPAIAAGTAQANDISFVRTTGSNANPCTLAKPCRSLQRAIRATANSGEIRVLDSGFFGNNATIQKSLTITGNGHTVLLGAPITVRNAGAVVALRRLTLNGKGTISVGIFIEVADTVHIEDCVIYGFRSDGILADSGVDGVFVVRTTARDNGGAGLHVGGGSVARMFDSTSTANGAGIRGNAGSTVETRGNNTIRGNGIDVIGTLTPFPGL